jgi:CubicO group peptidase (beta-lactamase class C family)/transcriptional antiterminator Rof (Rho-off)
MLKPYPRLITIVLFLTMALQSCTLTRIGVFVMPNVTDYKVFPTDTIYAASCSDPAYVEAKEEFQLPAIERWVPHAYRKGETNLDAFLKESQTTSLLIMRNDSLIYEKYANNHHAEDPQVIFSISKSITAMLVAIAIEEGKMDLHQRVADFIPEYGEDDRKQITIYHLLNMVSGIDFDDERDFGKLSLFYYSNNQDKFIRNFDEVKYEPGTHFAYGSMSTQVLSMCLEAATGQKIIDYLNEKIWEPLGMEYNALITTDSEEEGNHRAFGGFAMRSRDLIRLGKLLLNKGRWEGQQILPASFVKSLTKRSSPEDAYWGYRNCFWVDGYVHDDFMTDTDYFAAGFHGQFLYINPELNTIILRQGKKETFLWRFVLGRLAQEINGGSNDLTNPCKNFDQQFEGIYEANDGETFEIIYNGLNKKGEKEWIVLRDNKQTIELKDDMMRMTAFDGKCIGYRSIKIKSRIMFDLKDGKILGMHYDDRRAVDIKYYEKKGELPLMERRELLAQFR